VGFRFCTTSNPTNTAISFIYYYKNKCHLDLRLGIRFIKTIIWIEGGVITVVYANNVGTILKHKSTGIDR